MQKLNNRRNIFRVSVQIIIKKKNCDMFKPIKDIGLDLTYLQYTMDPGSQIYRRNEKRIFGQK